MLDAADTFTVKGNFAIRHRAASVRVHRTTVEDLLAWTPLSGPATTTDPVPAGRRGAIAAVDLFCDIFEIVEGIFFVFEVIDHFDIV